MQNDFQKTELAFELLDEALNNAEAMLKQKKEELDSQRQNAERLLEKSNEKNEWLKAEAGKVARNVDAVISHLDEVLEDVSGNHNN